MITKKQLGGGITRVCVRGYSKIQGKDHPNEKDNKSPQENDENSALVQRFTQILESKISESTPSILSKDPLLQRIYKKYATDDDRQFKSKYQKEISHLKSESLLNYNKHAKGLADTISNRPWDGNETVHDSNLRMILDLKPPPLKYQKSIITPPRSVKDRIESAKESSLDYRIGNTKKEDENFRELYKEKLLGPSVFLNTSSPHTIIGMANSLADAKINASINRNTGQFDGEMAGVRGKPLDKEYLKNCTDSNYFMNQILNKQEILPPWIDNQQSIDRQITEFRNNMDNEWFKSIFYNLKPTTLSKELMLTKLKNIIKNPNNFYDGDFHSRQLPYVLEKVKLLNNLIRDYNLQCPSSSIHKFKLVPEAELRKLYDRTLTTLVDQALKWYENEEAAKQRKNEPINYKDGGSFFGLFDNSGGGGSSTANDAMARQRTPEKLQLWKSIKEMFK